MKFKNEEPTQVALPITSLPGIKSFLLEYMFDIKATSFKVHQW